MSVRDVRGQPIPALERDGPEPMDCDEKAKGSARPRRDALHPAAAKKRKLANGHKECAPCTGTGTGTGEVRHPFVLSSL